MEGIIFYINSQILAYLISQVILSPFVNNTKKYLLLLFW